MGDCFSNHPRLSHICDRAKLSTLTEISAREDRVRVPSQVEGRLRARGCAHTVPDVTFFFLFRLCVTAECGTMLQSCGSHESSQASGPAATAVASTATSSQRGPGRAEQSWTKHTIIDGRRRRRRRQRAIGRRVPCSTIPAHNQLAPNYTYTPPPRRRPRGRPKVFFAGSSGPVQSGCPWLC